jgi:bifunctional DNA-binding transcriptional regulator/antitoxin component of YhaV-PrlF toxin-antitoxin module
LPLTPSRFTISALCKGADVGVISRKNQITIPVEELRKAGLAPGDDLRVVAAGPGRLQLVKADDLVEEFAGALDREVYPAGYLEDLRREWR